MKWNTECVPTWADLHSAYWQLLTGLENDHLEFVIILHPATPLSLPQKNKNKNKIKTSLYLFPSTSEAEKSRGSSTEIAGDVVGGHEAFQLCRCRLIGSAKPRCGELPPPPTSLSLAPPPSSHFGFGRARKTLTLVDSPNSQDMRKALGNMKSLAVDYERDGKSDKASAHKHFPI